MWLLYRLYNKIGRPKTEIGLFVVYIDPTSNPDMICSNSAANNGFYLKKNLVEIFISILAQILTLPALTQILTFLLLLIHCNRFITDTVIIGNVFDCDF